MTDRAAPSEAEALVERLRADADAVEKVSPDVGYHQSEPYGTGRFVRGKGSPALLTTAADLREAASLIERIAEQVADTQEHFARSLDVAASLRTEVERLQEAVCATCHNETWNPGEGWLHRKDGVVRVCRSAFHPEAERSLPPVPDVLKRAALDAGTTPAGEDART